VADPAGASQLALLVETQQAIASAQGSFVDVMRVVAERAVRLSGGDGAAVQVQDGEAMIYIAAAGAAVGYEGSLRLPLEGSLSGRALREQVTMVCIDSESDPRVHRETCRRVGARSLVVVPLRDAPGTPAVLSVYSSRPHAFREEDAQALELMARLAAATLIRSADLAAERHQVEQLRELDRLKDEVVAIVTHELRSPITSISGYLELVLEEAEGFDPEVRSFLDAIDRNTARLTRLLDDLLFLVRADAGRLDLKRERLDVAALVRECVNSAAPAAEQSEIVLETEIDEPLPVDADASRISQVIDNLLSNAIKYTPSGGRVSVVARESDGAVLLEVADSGIGIPQDEQEHLFERFFRASTATERGITGTGLGLTIVHAIVDAHGGTIACESESGAGTTFRVTLPRA
jgi:signal transduction histidine kinase